MPYHLFKNRSYTEVFAEPFNTLISTS